MDTENISIELQHHVYRGPERRRLLKRRIRPDQRSIIRFDAMGGDRRLGFARRSTDEGLRSDSFE
jgi:hypothetical protein